MKKQNVRKRKRKGRGTIGIHVVFIGLAGGAIEDAKFITRMSEILLEIEERFFNEKIFDLIIDEIGYFRDERLDFL